MFEHTQPFIIIRISHEVIDLIILWYREHFGGSVLKRHFFKQIQTLPCDTVNILFCKPCSNNHQTLMQSSRPRQSRKSVTMKTLAKAIITSNRLFTDFDDKYLFNVSELYDLLSQIRELREYPISLTEIYDGGLQINIADSIYQIFLLDNAERDCQQ